MARKKEYFAGLRMPRYSDGTIAPFKDSDTRDALVAYHKENLAARSPSRPSSSGPGLQGAGQGGDSRG